MLIVTTLIQVKSDLHCWKKNLLWECSDHRHKQVQQTSNKHTRAHIAKLSRPSHEHISAQVNRHNKQAAASAPQLLQLSLWTFFVHGQYSAHQNRLHLQEIRECLIHSLSCAACAAVQRGLPRDWRQCVMSAVSFHITVRGCEGTLHAVALGWRRPWLIQSPVRPATYQLESVFPQGGRLLSRRRRIPGRRENRAPRPFQQGVERGQAFFGLWR